jgi:hypothetical protein
MTYKKKIADKKNKSNIKGTRDDSFFAVSRRKRKRYMKIIIPAVAAAVAITVISAIMFSAQANNNINSNYGPVGSAHEHAAFAIKLDKVPIDFSQDKYQVQSRLIHVENNDGTTLHRHATGVPVGEFLKSIDMDIKNGCFILDDGREFCNTADKKLRYFVNGTEKESITDYVLNENDRMLVIYGDENNNEINQEINALRQVAIKR